MSEILINEIKNLPETVTTSELEHYFLRCITGIPCDSLPEREHCISLIQDAAFIIASLGLNSAYHNYKQLLSNDLLPSEIKVEIRDASNEFGSSVDNPYKDLRLD